MDLDTTRLTGMYVLGLVTGVTATLLFVLVALVMSHRDRPRGLSEVMATLDRLDQEEQEEEPISADEAEYARLRREQMEHGFRTVFAPEFEAERVAAGALGATAREGRGAG